MMMESAPPAPFIITKAEFLLELLIITLDPPPQLCQINQAGRKQHSRASWRTNTWLAPFRLLATRPAAILLHAPRSASCRDERAAPCAAQSAKQASRHCPRE